MVEFDKNQWKPAEAYFSIDNHLIFVDETSSVKNCMNILEVEYEINGFDLKLKEKEKGIFTTWNKEKLRFNSSNQIE